MNIKPSTDNMEEYLKEDEVIDYSNENIVRLVNALSQNADSEIEYIKAAYYKVSAAHKWRTIFIEG